MKFYIGTTLTNHAMAQLLAAALEAAGHTITCKWWTFLDGRELTWEAMADMAHQEEEGVRLADGVAILLPGGKGTHYEMGVARGAGKPVMLHDATGEAFEPGRGRTSFHFLWDIHRHAGDLAEGRVRGQLVHKLELMVQEQRAWDRAGKTYGHAANVVDILSRGAGA